MILEFEWGEIIDIWYGRRAERYLVPGSPKVVSRRYFGEGGHRSGKAWLAVRVGKRLMLIFVIGYASKRCRERSVAQFDGSE